MTIHNQAAYIEAGKWDYNHFKACFAGSKIEMSDIDGVVERNGYYLVIETKPPTAEIPEGQAISLTTLTEVYGFVVIRVWGRPNFPERTLLSHRPKGRVEFQEDNNATMDSLKELIRKWYVWADKQPKRRPA